MMCTFAHDREIPTTIGICITHWSAVSTPSIAGRPSSILIRIQMRITSHIRLPRAKAHVSVVYDGLHVLLTSYEWHRADGNDGVMSFCNCHWVTRIRTACR